MDTSTRMWGGEGGSEQLKEMGRTRRTLARGGCEEKALALKATTAPDGGERAAEVAQEQKALTSSLLSVLFGLSPTPITLQLRPSYTVSTKPVCKVRNKNHSAENQRAYADS